MGWRLGSTLGLAGLLGTLCACDPEVIVYEKDPGKKDVGVPCVIDSECGTGRCSAGVCVVNECDTDEDCREGEICNPITHTCESVEAYACAPGQSPIIQLDVTSVDFGTVTVGERASDAVVVNNIGDCLLTVRQALIDSGVSDPEISCSNCAADDYPKLVPPGHSFEIFLEFAPLLEREHTAVLQIRSDDLSMPDGIVEVVLRGQGLGHPRMSIEPVLIDFGHVGVNDPAVSEVVQVTNVGAGTLEISRIFADPFTSGMSVSPVVGPTDPALELVANQVQELTVTFDPTSLAPSNAVLYIFSNDVARTCAADPNNTPGVGCVELKGDSRGPPAIQLSHTAIDFGQQLLGTSHFEMVTISNSGTSDLTISVSMTVLSSTDFRYDPPTLSVIPPGGNSYLNIIYEPAGLNQQDATLQVQSNDPVTPLRNISLTGFGLSPYANDTLKVEMTFENGDDGFFGNDFRDVNLYLESPYGELCEKATPNPDWTHGGTNDQTNFGHPQWNAIGVAEEPERVILFDAHEDAYGTFKGCVYYREDCQMIPTDILAGLMGIGVSALLAGLTEGLITPDAGDVAEFIANNCWDHGSSRALLSTFVNGQQVHQTSVRLGSKGDHSCPVTVQRINGLYCVSGASPPQAGCP